jgi:hypothetical protein
MENATDFKVKLLHDEASYFHLVDYRSVPCTGN